MRHIIILYMGGIGYDPWQARKRRWSRRRSWCGDYVWSNWLRLWDHHKRGRAFENNMIYNEPHFGALFEFYIDFEKRILFKITCRSIQDHKLNIIQRNLQMKDQSNRIHLKLQLKNCMFCMEISKCFYWLPRFLKKSFVLLLTSTFTLA